MKAQLLTAWATTAITAGLTSCIWETDPVPEIPYRPQPVLVQVTEPQQTEQPTQPVTTWETAPAPASHITPSPAPASKPASTAVQAKPDSSSQPAAAVQPVPPPVPETSTYSAPAAPSAPPAASPSPAPDLKLITNDGPIPTAARVEGDPTRVWNPLDPSKTIRIINPKTNQPYPSGKKLKVRGTNYQFIVP